MPGSGRSTRRPGRQVRCVRPFPPPTWPPQREIPHGTVRSCHPSSGLAPERPASAQRGHATTARRLQCRAGSLAPRAPRRPTRARTLGPLVRPRALYARAGRGTGYGAARRPAAPAERCDNTSPGDPERGSPLARAPVPHAWRMEMREVDMHVAYPRHSFGWTAGVRLPVPRNQCLPRDFPSVATWRHP
jgi:hypothetical protein